VNVDTVGVIYDAFGRTLERNNGGNYSRIIYGLRGEKIAIVSGANLINGYVALPAGGTAVYTSSGLSFYRHPDWLGSARFASTPSRTMHYSRAFAPYGETNNGSSSVDRTFTGQNQDTVDGIYDFMFRRYDPTHGRWTSPDPAGIAAVDPAAPQSWNRYAYVGGNPLSAVDPLGLQPVYYVDGVMVAPGNFRGIMDSGAGMFCGSNCPAPVVLAKGGFAFPTVNVDGSVTWSVTDRAGNELTDAAMEEALGGYSLGTVATNRLFFFGSATGAYGSTSGQNSGNRGTRKDKPYCGDRLAQGVQRSTGTAVTNVQYSGTVGGHANYTFDVPDTGAFQSVLDQNGPWPLPFGLDTGYRYGTVQSTHIRAPLSTTGSYSGHTDLFGGHSLLLPLHLIVDFAIGHIPGVDLDFGCRK
jgi:RHS repeat-associated protein